MAGSINIETELLPEKSNRRDGFTIMEILIAMVVLSLGLLGILGVFPAGIKKTAEIVEDTNAAMIVESVRNSIDMGLRNARIDDGTDKGFVYLGEGVEALLEDNGHILPIDITTLDSTPPSLNKAADYWIKLPSGTDDAYLYPRTDPNIYTIGPYTTHNLPPVKRVFPCGSQIRKDSKDLALSLVERDEALRDPYTQYSYAFIIKKAKDTQTDSLYDLTVMIYRNFPSRQFEQGNETAGFESERHQPVKIFKTLVAY